MGVEETTWIEKSGKMNYIVDDQRSEEVSVLAKARKASIGRLPRGLAYHLRYGAA